MFSCPLTAVKERRVCARAACSNPENREFKAEARETFDGCVFVYLCALERFLRHRPRDCPVTCSVKLYVGQLYPECCRCFGDGTSQRMSRRKQSNPKPLKRKLFRKTIISNFPPKIIKKLLVFS